MSHGTTNVGVGVLSHNGRYFIAQRPAGKVREGLWEFPGGKVERRESFEECIAREYVEEFGVRIMVGPPAITWTWEYPDGRFRMHARLCWFHPVTDQEPRALEGHRFEWVSHHAFTHYDWVPSGWPLVVHLLAQATVDPGWVWKRAANLVLAEIKEFNGWKY